MRARGVRICRFCCHGGFGSQATAGEAGAADFTYAPTWAGMVHRIAFVIEAYSRRILGGRAATSMKTCLILDALKHAL